MTTKPAATHTPTPWKKILAPTQIITDDRIIANMVYGDPVQIAHDANFIVRAVNAHDELLEALKALSIHIRGKCNHETTDECSDAMGDIVVKAIVKAEGK